MENKHKWSSIDIVKVLLSVIMPILLFGLGFFTKKMSDEQKSLRNDFQKYLERVNKNNDRIYDIRLNIYDSIKIPVNEIFCYVYYIGKWKELSPEEILNNKRFCDELMYSSQSFFSDEFFVAYEDFMKSAFLMYNGAGEDAKIKSDIISHRNYSNIVWKSTYANRFVAQGVKYNDYEVRQNIRKSYDNLMTLLSKEINVEEREIVNEFKDYKPS